MLPTTHLELKSWYADHKDDCLILGDGVRLDNLYSRLYVLLSGRLTVLRRRDDGRTVLAALLQPGATFGAGLVPSSRCTVQTLGRCILWYVPSYEVLQDDSVQWSLLRTQAAYIGQVFDSIEAHAYYRTFSRQLAGLLLRLARKNEVAASHYRLADMLATHRECVSELIRQWRMEGLIDSGYGWTRILDRAGLQKIVEGQHV